MVWYFFFVFVFILFSFCFHFVFVLFCFYFILFFIFIHSEWAGAICRKLLSHRNEFFPNRNRTCQCCTMRWKLVWMCLHIRGRLCILLVALCYTEHPLRRWILLKIREHRQETHLQHPCRIFVEATLFCPYPLSNNGKTDWHRLNKMSLLLSSQLVCVIPLLKLPSRLLLTAFFYDGLVHVCWFRESLCYSTNIGAPWINACLPIKNNKLVIKKSIYFFCHSFIFITQSVRSCQKQQKQQKQQQQQ